MTITERSPWTASVAAVRGLIIDTVEHAGNGHVGAALALAPLGCAIYGDVLRHDPARPDWPDRDRLVLSAGHASAWQYVLLHLAGYDVTLDDLRSFRRLGSRTPGHPEYGVTPGVETTTGPLGQGLATAVGLAVAERLLAARFNRPGFEIVDHATFVVASDGDLMEGVSQEAISLAGQWGLDKLVVCYDSNGITIDGPTSLSFGVEDQVARFRASGWVVEQVAAVEDVEVLADALRRVRNRRDGRPTLLILPTEIGYPAEAVRGTTKAHGSPLGAVEAARTKAALGLDPAVTFGVPDVGPQMLDARPRGSRERSLWEKTFAEWSREFPELRTAWDAAHGPIPRDVLAGFAVPTHEPVSPRNVSRLVLDELGNRLPTMTGGAADLVDSTKTALAAAGVFTAAAPDRNLAFGVREHGMAAVVNGLALHGGISKPFGSTFLTFGDYMRPAVRLSAVMGLPVVWIWTHDSIAIGADGRTHQPIEHLASLRAMPGIWVMRPADAHETTYAWRAVLARTEGPVALVLARQLLPVLAEAATDAAAEGVARGGYVLAGETGDPDIVLLASGSEVHLVLAAARELADAGTAVRVVSMPCWELFEAQDAAYRDAVLPPAVRTRLAVEAGSSMGWHRWVGLDGDVVSVDDFGASDHGDVLLRHFGMTVANVVAAAHRLLGLADTTNRGEEA
ncbi:transketolase [Micromonospora sp. C95]|uniref:transketolase n=1 Tax=Micromonospora sp. C95 TaxID=2824882 RepID=UPI0027DD59C5|nr:transketolase [Micromonospora sp. C95]